MLRRAFLRSFTAHRRAFTNASRTSEASSFDSAVARIHSPVMVGRYADDRKKYFDDDKPLATLRTRAQIALDKRDADSFILVALQTIKYLGNSELAKSPFYLPPSLMYLDPPSPAAEVMDEILRKAFSKACDVRNIPHGHLNNNSGRAISGSRGVGKSYCLRTCAIVMSVLLDHVVAVWVGLHYCGKEFPISHSICTHQGSMVAVWGVLTCGAAVQPGILAGSCSSQ